MKLFLLTLAAVAFCVIALSITIILKKDGKFPDGEIEHNKALRKQGIQCAKVEERILWGRKKNRKNTVSCTTGDCSGCGASCLEDKPSGR